MWCSKTYCHSALISSSNSPGEKYSGTNVSYLGDPGFGGLFLMKGALFLILCLFVLGFLDDRDGPATGTSDCVTSSSAVRNRFYIHGYGTVSTYMEYMGRETACTITVQVEKNYMPKGLFYFKKNLFFILSLLKYKGARYLVSSCAHRMTLDNEDTLVH